MSNLLSILANQAEADWKADAWAPAILYIMLMWLSVLGNGILNGAHNVAGQL